jgi:hypothetical protein
MSRYSDAIRLQQNIQYNLVDALEDMKRCVEYLADECGIDDDPEIDGRMIRDALAKAADTLVDHAKIFVTGTGQILSKTHSKDQCYSEDCVIHNPSIHHMLAWPTHFREDNGLMERICPHGIGHPDPDDPKSKGYVHGCDGCCNGPTE